MDQRAQAQSLADIRAAQRQMRQQRALGWAALNDIFRAGQPVRQPLDGIYQGEFIALNLAPGLTQIGEALFAWWMPWKGKQFDATSHTGNNLLERRFYAAAHLIWPFYHHYTQVGPQTFHAFTFQTSMATGIADHDRQVFRLNYNLAGNPRLNVRRVVDELVEVADGYFLGKAHLQWLWGTWQLVAYFALCK